MDTTVRTNTMTIMLAAIIAMMPAVFAAMPAVAQDAAVKASASDEAAADVVEAQAPAATDESTTDEAATDEAATDNAATDGSVADEPAATDATPDEPAIEATEESATDASATEAPPTTDSAVDVLETELPTLDDEIPTAEAITAEDTGQPGTLSTPLETVTGRLITKKPEPKPPVAIETSTEPLPASLRGDAGEVIAQLLQDAKTLQCVDDDLPQWVEQSRDGQKVTSGYEMSVSVGPVVSPNQCEELLAEELKVRIAEYATGIDGPAQVELTGPMVGRLVKECVFQHTDYNVGKKMYRLHARLVFDGAVREMVREQVKRAEQKLRVLRLVSAVAVLVLGLAIAYPILRRSPRSV